MVRPTATNRPAGSCPQRRAPYRSRNHDRRFRRYHPPPPPLPESIRDAHQHQLSDAKGPTSVPRLIRHIGVSHEECAHLTHRFETVGRTGAADSASTMQDPARTTPGTPRSVLIRPALHRVGSCANRTTCRRQSPGPVMRAVRLFGRCWRARHPVSTVRRGVRTRMARSRSRHWARSASPRWVTGMRTFLSQQLVRRLPVAVRLRRRIPDPRRQHQPPIQCRDVRRLAHPVYDLLGEAPRIRTIHVPQHERDPLVLAEDQAGTSFSPGCRRHGRHRLSQSLHRWDEGYVHEHDDQGSTCGRQM